MIYDRVHASGKRDAGKCSAVQLVTVTYIYISIYISLSLSLYIYIYIYIYLLGVSKLTR